MKSTRMRVGSAAAGALALLAQSGTAGAFCRTRTCEFRLDQDCPTDPVTGCSESGAFVFWNSGCVPYAVQRDGSRDEGISAQQVAGLLDQGFRSWSQLACPGGGTPILATSRQGLIACDAVEFDCKAGSQNSNLVLFRDDFQDGDSALVPGVIALTTVTANLVSGEIFDADMEINSRDEDFVLGAPGGSGARRDLRGVINHELGHLLGLSHSRVRGALMQALYEGLTTPSADDAAGICAALETGTSDPACSVEPLASDAACLGSDATCTRIGTSAQDPAGGCACREAGSQPAGPFAWAWVLCLGLGLARRTSQPRQTVL
jgi:hypothetical protein